MEISLIFLVVIHVHVDVVAVFVVDYKNVICVLKIIAFSRHETNVLLSRSIPCRNNPIVYRIETVVCNECLISKAISFCIKMSVMVCVKMVSSPRCQIKKPIGNSPFTLSKLLAGTTKFRPSFARKAWRKSRKFGACSIFKVEN